MGRTKALVEVRGVPMGRRVASALEGAGCSTVVAYGGDPAELAPLGVQVLPDRHPAAGPLGAIVGLIDLFGGDDAAGGILVVACDLAYLDAADLEPLVAANRARPDADVVLAVGVRREPTCAIWRPAVRSRLRSRFDGGERAIHRVLDELEVVEVPVAAAALRNINTPDDLDRYA